MRAGRLGTRPAVADPRRLTMADDAGSDLLQRILQAAAINPGRPALSGNHGKTLRYRDLAIAVVATAKGLRRNGFLPGQRLLFALRPDPASIVLALATVAAGGSAVFTGADTAADLFTSRATLTEATWVAAAPEFYAAGATRPLSFLTRRTVDERPDFQKLGVRGLRTGPWRPGVPSGTLSVRGLAKGRRVVDDEPLAGLQPAVSAEAAILFTSGTPGRPRAVVHTRGSLGTALSGLADRLGLDNAATVFTDQLLMGLPALTVGAHWRLPPAGLSARVDPARFSKSMGRATHTFLFPADLAAVLTAQSERLAPKPPALQEIIVSGGAVLPALVGRTLAVLPGVRLLAVYGTTEMMPIALAEGTDKLTADPDGDLVGDLQPGVHARISENGELIVAGRGLAAGYLGEPPLAEHATGDLAMLRGGSVVLLGRKQDVIMRGDTAIYPAVHELVIEQLPGVGHAAIVGVPDEIGNERVVLVLQPAGQPVNDSPLAGDPKQADRRGATDPGQIAVLLHHPLASAVGADLPALVDPVALPDQIVVLSAIPTMGRDRRPDRTALSRLVADLAADD